MVKRKTYNNTKNRNKKRRTRKQYGGSYTKYNILNQNDVFELENLLNSSNNIILAFPRNIYFIENDLICVNSNIIRGLNNEPMKIEIKEAEIDDILKKNYNNFPVAEINNKYGDIDRDQYLFLYGEPVVIKPNPSKDFYDFTDSSRRGDNPRPNRINEFIYLSTTMDKINKLLQNENEFTVKKLVRKPLPYNPSELPSDPSKLPYDPSELPSQSNHSSLKPASFLERLISYVTPKHEYVSEFEKSQIRKLKKLEKTRKKHPILNNNNNNTRKIHPIRK